MSDTLGFVFVFSIVVISTSIVAALGTAGLRDVRDAERIDNAENAMDVLADNTEDIYLRGAPSRATEIKLSEARIGFGEQTTLTVTVGGNTFTRETRPLVYESDGTRLVYEAGAILRTEEDQGTRMTLGPRLRLDGGNTVIPMVLVKSPRDGSVGGSTTLLVRSTRTDEATLASLDGSPTVTITVETASSRVEAWQRWLTEATPTGTTCSITGGDTVQCSYTTGSAIVSQTTMQFFIER